jgi:PAS domain S-box-containing protein
MRRNCLKEVAMASKFSTRKRLAATLFLAALFTATLVYITYSCCVLPQFQRLEENTAAHHMEQLRTNLQVELDNLNALVHDYASMETPEHTTLAKASPYWHHLFSDQLLSHHGLDRIAIYDEQGTLLFTNSTPAGDTEKTPEDMALYRTAFNLTRLSSKQAISGLLLGSRGISLVTARTIANPAAETSGVIIFCRQLSTQVIAQWSRRLKIEISLSMVPHNNNAIDNPRLDALLQSPQSCYLSRSAQQTTASSLLLDIGGTPIAILQLTIPAQSLSGMLPMSAILAVTTLVLLLITYLTARIFAKTAQGPFFDLAHQVHQIRQLEDKSALAPAKETDELTREINALLVDLEESRQNQSLSEVKTNLIKKVVPCAIFTVDHRRVITSWNNRAEQLTGYAAHEMIGSSCYRFALTPCHRQCGLFNPQTAKPVMGRECTIRHKNGTLLTISKNAELLRDVSGDVIGGIECFVDITHHKRDEQALQWEVALNSRLASLSHTIVQQHCDQEEIARQLLSHARNLTGSQHGFIAALDSCGTQLLWDYTSLFEDFIKTDGSAIIPAASSGRGSLLHAVYNRKTGVYFNGLERLNVAHLAGGIQKPFRHFMAVPVDNGDRIIGQVALANNEEGYSVRDLQAIEQLAELFAVFLARKPIAS